MPKTVVAIGEALWDVFPDRRLPGGAPCNVAFHAARLGDRGAIITRVGEDPAGTELVAFLGERGVVTDCIQRDERRPTGTVMVTIEDSEPRYNITEKVAWDYITAGEDACAIARRADAICVGSLAQRGRHSRSAIHRLLSEARGQARIIFDVNLRPPFVDPGILDVTFRLADVVKLSESEVDRASALLDRRSLTDWLLEDTGVEVVCVTRGKDGASITTHSETVSAPGIEIDASTGDAVGAGDAFTAALAHQLVRNAPAEEILSAANRYAALVATKKGAMPTLSDEDLTAIGL
jgi:fructokinase